MQRILAVCLLLLVAAGAAFADGGLKKKRPRADEYGTVLIDNYSGKAGLAGVTFEHWSHRAQYTCRLCHVDIGFAMRAGATEMTAADNQRGYYCGACHNGKRTWTGRMIFAACAQPAGPQDQERCVRCHISGRNPVREQAFQAFAANLPKERFGNGIDWEKAEAEGLIKPAQYLDGLSVKRPALAVQKDFELEADVSGMPEIIFSHKKHTLWNGCELCHPDIFIGITRGASKYTMVDLFAGKYCGVCHDKVAFPQIDCQRCHVRAVQ